MRMNYSGAPCRCRTEMVWIRHYLIKPLRMPRDGSHADEENQYADDVCLYQGDIIGVHRESSMLSARVLENRPRERELNGMGSLANNSAAQPVWSKIACSVDREHFG